MGRCSCFGRKKGVKRKNLEDAKPNPGPSNVPGFPSVKSKTNAQRKQELSISKHGSDAKRVGNTFTYRELATATNNFKKESYIGEGGFGKVFRGQIETTGQAIAVKQLNKTGFQGDKEFLVEILMLSILRHPNLVNLIGYCAEGDQRLLVYEYMPLGSLEYHLHDLTPDMEPLDWNTRMRIAAGAARGLDYLHNQANPPVIYRDLKSSNILLDEGYHPKLSDFGLAKFGPAEDKSHVSTRVMGTHGYCAPEYGASGKLTMKSDIYSFGVVLLELITGRRALEASGGEKRSLVEWARPMLRDRENFVQLADPRLRGHFSESALRRFLETALMCLRTEAHKRPSVSDVVLALDYLASHPYDPKVARGSRVRDGRGRRVPGAGREGQRNMNAEDYKGPDDTPKETSLSNKDVEREQAVAEAKVWGETCREQRRLSAETDFDACRV
ncbi:hypothetical protein RJ640_028171 [Escallonia rubra]|uniref:Protein kinase domain-containing protein n=1 Tax=Escallonia rubra TaxID=112253 RepID=A0AA88QFK9_9ASTE|nr:hypothetical protein RJ640_028171 [Escallonia rubra]